MKILEKKFSKNKRINSKDNYIIIFYSINKINKINFVLFKFFCFGKRHIILLFPFLTNMKKNKNHILN